jgi:hypothetical protein
MAMVKLRLLGARAGLRSLLLGENRMVGYFTEETTNNHGEQFNKWLGSMIRHATVPFEFLQDHGVGFRLSFADPAQMQAEAEGFLRSLVAARVEARSKPLEPAIKMTTKAAV